jgi:glycosyltransferase involved in cell wall biosynthesis
VSFFSIVIPTRNRPGSFRRALKSVLAQSFLDIEIIIVNDGSAAEYQPEYSSIISAVKSNRIRSFALIPRPKGHGGSYARNSGAAEANAPYLCFLDDDDYWTDRDHLGRARAVIAASTDPVDLYMTNQAAFLRDERQPEPIWIENLPTILARRGNRPDRRGAHSVTVDELLQSGGFCHLNTLIVRRELYDEVGGMAETIRWEEDRDLYLRLIDRALVIKYFPLAVARHNIPDPTRSESVTTALSELERRLFRLTVFDRALHLASHPLIRAHARQQKAYTLKRISEALDAAGRPIEAALYAREALGTGPTAKWTAYTAWLTLRALWSKSAIKRPIGGQYLREDQRNGRQEAYDIARQYQGYYDGEHSVAKDHGGATVAKGNALAARIFRRR